MAAAPRFYLRLLRPSDLQELQTACIGMFAFDAPDCRLSEALGSDRWLCLGACTRQAQQPGSEVILGFAVAALGGLGEFPAQEAQQVQAIIQQDGAAAGYNTPNSSSSNSGSSSSSRSSSRSSSAGSNSNSRSDPIIAELVLLGVVPSARRRGVASRLLAQVRAAAALRGAVAVFLHVQDSNWPARALYTKAGYSAAGRLPGYYDDARRTSAALGSGVFSGHDAELLVLPLVALGGRGAPVAGAGGAANPAAGVTLDQQSSILLADEPGGQSGGQDGGAAPGSTSVPHQPGAATTPAAAQDVATAAAAAAVRLLLGPAAGLLNGLLPPASGDSGGDRNAAQRGVQLVRLGDDWVVQVQRGGTVELHEPDALPTDVALSKRDAELLARLRGVDRPTADKHGSGSSGGCRGEEEDEGSSGSGSGSGNNHDPPSSSSGGSGGSSSSSNIAVCAFGSGNAFVWPGAAAAGARHGRRDGTPCARYVQQPRLGRTILQRAPPLPPRPRRLRVAAELQLPQVHGMLLVHVPPKLCRQLQNRPCPGPRLALPHCQGARSALPGVVKLHALWC
jgi:ribosomal protein S18 acetylase RimI-like enzyme